MLNSQRTHSVVWRNDHKIRADRWSWGKRLTVREQHMWFQTCRIHWTFVIPTGFVIPGSRLLFVWHTFYFLLHYCPWEMKILRESITARYLNSYFLSLSCGWRNSIVELYIHVTVHR